MWQIVWQVGSVIAFYGMFALLLYLLYWIGCNIKIYAHAWQTLIDVYKQNADSLQKMADAVYILAKNQEKPPV